MAKMSASSSASKGRRLITASSGNHGIGTASAARSLDKGLTVVLPESVVRLQARKDQGVRCRCHSTRCRNRTGRATCTTPSIDRTIHLHLTLQRLRRHFRPRHHRPRTPRAMRQSGQHLHLHGWRRPDQWDWLRAQSIQPSHKDLGYFCFQFHGSCYLDTCRESNRD